jgi:hypothetical protein
LTNKLKPIRQIDKYRIILVKGSMVSATSLSTNQVVTRNSSCFRKSSLDIEATSVPEIGLGLDMDLEVNLGQQLPILDPLIEQQITHRDNLEQNGVSNELRRSNRTNKGSIDKLQVNPSKKSYTK